MKILIETFSAPGCAKCAQARRALKSVAEELAGMDKAANPPDSDPGKTGGQQLGRIGARRIVFGAVCPACTPALVVLLGIAAGVGSPLFGVLLLLAFALGRAVPVIVGASAVGWLEGLEGLRYSQRAFEIAGGVVLVLSGFYMLNAHFFVIPELAA